MTDVRDAEHRTTRVLRSLLLAVLLFGVLGTLAELYLLEHYEDWWQLVPLLLLGGAAPVIARCWALPSAATLRALQGLMLLFVIAGALGVYQHYTGNAEFELEMYPRRAGFELFWESLKGATPALAPGTMTIFGLLGLATIFRHPGFASKE